MAQQPERKMAWEDKVRILKAKFKKTEDMHEYLVTRSKFSPILDHDYECFFFSGLLASICQQMQAITHQCSSFKEEEGSSTQGCELKESSRMA